MSTEPTDTLVLRCPREQCTCRPGGGKLLATLLGAPRALAHSGCVLQLACPNRKAKLIRIRL